MPTQIGTVNAPTSVKPHSPKVIRVQAPSKRPIKYDGRLSPPQEPRPSTPGIKTAHAPQIRDTHRVVPWHDPISHPNYAGAYSLEPTSSPAQDIQNGNKHLILESPHQIDKLVLESI